MQAPTNAIESRLLKIETVAHLLDASRDSVRGWIRQGVIPSEAIVRFGRIVRVKASYIEGLAGDAR